MDGRPKVAVRKKDPRRSPALREENPQIKGNGKNRLATNQKRFLAWLGMTAWSWCVGYSKMAAVIAG
jgi:hypothetical protein